MVSEEWNLSFAGCGFRSIYYVGALSCILEQVPQLVHGASKICGASSGCLVAAALAVGIPIEELCMDILTIAREARTYTLGVFHPTFSLLRSVRDSLLQKLPKDAHLQATGRLCVSLTRMSDGSNVLVSEFASRDELIQVLMCSCFFPVYSGFIPPSYRGVHYMDGALSNNVPLCEQRNTLIMAPFSGESDICPREGTYNLLEVHYGNVSIQVNTGNVHRVCTSFFPPRIQMLAEICHNGYKDALCFLKERDLLGPQNNSHVKEAAGDKRCCELAKGVCRTEQKDMAMENGKLSAREDHLWLDPRVIESLPEAIQRVLCEACRDSSQDGVTWWPHLMYPLRLIVHLLNAIMLPMQLTQQLIRRFWGSLLIYRLMTSAALYRQTWRTRSCDQSSEQLCSSESSDLSDLTGGEQNIHMLISATERDFEKDVCREKRCDLDLFSSNSADTSACVRQTSNSVLHTNTGKQKLHRKKTV